jgi:hypothetical protein
MARDDSSLLERVRAVIVLSTKEVEEVIARSHRLLGRPRDDVRSLDSAGARVASERVSTLDSCQAGHEDDHAIRHGRASMRVPPAAGRERAGDSRCERFTGEARSRGG